MGHLAFRASSRPALERRVEAIEATGFGRGWIEGNKGHGPAYRFATPDGHARELIFEVDPFEAPPEERTPFLNRPQKRPDRGIPVRRLDHVNLIVSEVKPSREFFMDTMGFRLHEQLVMNNGSEVGAWMAVTNLVHDIAVMGDRTGSCGRLHRVCYWYGYPQRYWYGYPQHLMDVADLFTESEYRLEAGPGKHGISQVYFLYIFEPGGNRVELFGDVGYLIFDPHWKPIVWGEENVDTSIIWFGSPLPDSYFTTGSPDVGRAEESEDEELVEAVEEVSRESSKVGRGPNPDA